MVREKLGSGAGGYLKRGWFTNRGGLPQFFIAGNLCGAGGYLIGGGLLILTLHYIFLHQNMSDHVRTPPSLPQTIPN